jgi:hypothetical protein
MEEEFTVPLESGGEFNVLMIVSVFANSTDTTIKITTNMPSPKIPTPTVQRPRSLASQEAT